MSDVTISVPTTWGESRQITGTEYGPFIIHKNASQVLLDDLDLDVWSVTHKATGVRFPWSFFAPEAAAEFARDVIPIMDWENIGVDLQLDKSESKALWTKSAPTKEQSDAVRAAAAARGGIRINNIMRDEIASA